MKALIFHDIGDIRLEEVNPPKIKDLNDAIIKITTSAICGTDLHFIRGIVGSMKKRTILGHEAVGIVEEIGKEVRNFKEGTRVIVPSTVACGYCRLCRKGFYSQCDVANPNEPSAGTAFFGGPEASGPLQGYQAEYVRIPLANNNLVILPDEVSDAKAILLLDIFLTAYFGAKEFKQELSEIASKSKPKDKNWIPGNAPSQALRIDTKLVSKCGTISIIGVYPSPSRGYPIGEAMNKNLKIVMGNCHHRAYIPHLLHKVQTGIVDPTKILTQIEPMTNIIEAYQQFDARETGWVKVALKV